MMNLKKLSIEHLPVEKPTDDQITRKTSENIIISSEAKKLSKAKKGQHKHKKGTVNISKGHESENYNIRAAWMHILGDTIQSIGIIIAALIIYFFPSTKILDPIMSIVFSVIAVSFSIPVFKDIIRLLMDSSPPLMAMNIFLQQLKNIKYVLEVHDLHIWLLTYAKPALTVHIKCSQN